MNARDVPKGLSSTQSAGATPRDPRPGAPSDVRHDLHSSLFAVDMAVRSLAAAADPDERAQLGRAVGLELERIHGLVRELDLRPAPGDFTGDEPAV